LFFWRSRKKRLRLRAKKSHNRQEFLQHRYPGISPEELSDRLQRFQQLIGETAHLKVARLADQVYRISP
jgi:hypothetical protein